MAVSLSMLPRNLTLLPTAERQKILSSSRLKVALASFIAILVAALCGVVFLFVAHIFDWLTPRMQQDLGWKVARGAVEVAERGELALILKDEPMLQDAFDRYAKDEDVQAIVAADPDGRVIATHGALPIPASELFAVPRSQLNQSKDYVWSWTEQLVEGASVGRVAMVASTLRLEAGRNLRHRIVVLTGVAGLLGLLLSLSFVRWYVGPLLKVTGRAFEGLERAAGELLHKQRLEKELEIGARIQTCLLPRTVTIPELELSAKMVPASEVGGDYYDAFAAGSGGFIGIGDVAGHGLTAGLVMLMVQSVVGALARQAPDAAPSELVCALNTVLYDNIRHRLRNKEHVTFTLLRYQPGGKLSFAGAHEEICVLRKRSGRTELVETPGTWLGAMRDVRKHMIDTSLQLELGDIVLLYTDGVTEARAADGSQFGLERLTTLLEDSSDLPIEALIDRLYAAVASFAKELDDDVTLLAFRYVG
ncbi:MAG TPA: PP2C family protein-serine/threonine phosphatase [Polyangiaceae bacterium]|nr:PP2C family protein-serine/threonine phosphatase [Polyangiaceae bacterium]